MGMYLQHITRNFCAFAMLLLSFDKNFQWVHNFIHHSFILSFFYLGAFAPCIYIIALFAGVLCLRNFGSSGLFAATQVVLLLCVSVSSTESFSVVLLVALRKFYASGLLLNGYVACPLVPRVARYRSPWLRH